MTNPRVKIVFVLLLALAASASAFALMRPGLWRHFVDSQDLIALLRDHYAMGALLCVSVEFLQVVVPPIPGTVVEFAIGYVFGPWVGFTFAMLGALLGSVASFGVARVIGRPAVEHVVKRSSLAKLDRLLATARGKAGLLTIFLLPSTPKDTFCYAAGLSSLRTGEFSLIAGLGRAPSVLLGVLIGAGIASRDRHEQVLAGAIVVVVIAAYWLIVRPRSSLGHTSPPVPIARAVRQTEARRREAS